MISLGRGAVAMSFVAPGLEHWGPSCIAGFYATSTIKEHASTVTNNRSRSNDIVLQQELRMFVLH